MRKPQEQLYADNYLPLQSLLIALGLSLAILYWGLQRTLNLPSIPALLLAMAGILLGEGTKERLQVLLLELGFGGNGAGGVGIGVGSHGGVVARVRASARTILGLGADINGGPSLRGIVGGGFGGAGGGEVTVGGLWNMGNTCYQNSVLQAMASLGYLEPHLEVLSTPEAMDDEELHPAASLMELFTALNTPRKAHQSAYVPNIIRRVDASSSGWMYNEQQDAQEFFQKLTAAVEKEVSRYWARKKPVAGLETVGLLFGSGEDEEKKKEEEKVEAKEEEEEKVEAKKEEEKVEAEKEERLLEKSKILTEGSLEKMFVQEKLIPEELKNPFEGLAAQRVGCLRCGYVEEIRLQSFTSLSLSLPSTFECSLEECLKEYTEIERIEQVECDKCTLLAQKRWLETTLAQNHTTPTTTNGSTTPQTAAMKAQFTQRLEMINDALEADDYSSSTVSRIAQRKITATKTKQTMIARPPPILVLHLNRSQFDMMSGVTRKNFAAVSFPMVLHLGGVVTGMDGMEMDPGKPISRGAAVGLELFSENEQEGREVVERVAKEGLLYELKSVITHYGGHHNGHYICYREAGGRWWRVNDERVAEVGVEEVRDVGNAFMIFYERVDEGKARGILEGKRREVLQARKMVEAQRKGEAELGLEVEVEMDSGSTDGTGDGGKKAGGSGGGVVRPPVIAGRGFGTDSDVDAILAADGDQLLKELVAGNSDDGEEDLPLTDSNQHLANNVPATMNGNAHHHHHNHQTDGIPNQQVENGGVVHGGAGGGDTPTRQNAASQAVSGGGGGGAGGKKSPQQQVQEQPQLQRTHSHPQSLESAFPLSAGKGASTSSAASSPAARKRKKQGKKANGAAGGGGEKEEGKVVLVN